MRNLAQKAKDFRNRVLEDGEEARIAQTQYHMAAKRLSAPGAASVDLRHSAGERVSSRQGSVRSSVDLTQLDTESVGALRTGGSSPKRRWSRSSTGRPGAPEMGGKFNSASLEMAALLEAVNSRLAHMDRKLDGICQAVGGQPAAEPPQVAYHSDFSSESKAQAPFGPRMKWDSGQRPVAVEPPVDGEAQIITSVDSDKESVHTVNTMNTAKSLNSDLRVTFNLSLNHGKPKEGIIEGTDGESLATCAMSALGTGSALGNSSALGSSSALVKFKEGEKEDADGEAPGRSPTMDFALCPVDRSVEWAAEGAARQVEEMQRWFERLRVTGDDPDEKVSVGLSAEQILVMMEVSLGADCVLDLESVRDALRDLNAMEGVHEMVTQGQTVLNRRAGWTERRNSRWSTHGTYKAHEAKAASNVAALLTPPVEESLELVSDIMTWPAFARLMLFDFVDNVSPDDTDSLTRFSLIREALVRSSIENLIVQYSHVKLPQSYGNESGFASAACLTKIVEPTVACMILCNALTLGFQADYTGVAVFRYIELCFTAFFVGEILLKMAIFGPRRYICGPEKAWTWFDIFVVLLALVDLMVTEMFASGEILHNMTLFRVGRLARLTKMMRLLRLLRMRMFKELALMVKGVIAGLRTLFWALVLLVVVAYALGVVLRQSIGYDDVVSADVYGTVLFNSVPWSMFMVFRCVTSDCVLADGSPLVAHLHELYGYTFTLPYVISVIFVTFGIFNLITATFVENVMESAKQKKTLSSEGEAIRVFTKLRALVFHFGAPEDLDLNVANLRGRRNAPTEVAAWSSRNSSASAGVQSRASVKLKPVAVHFAHGAQVTREVFEHMVANPRVQDLFDELEIHIRDRYELFDVIDADSDGAIDVSELIIGILKLRTTSADKSDMVAAMLGIRAIQKSVGMLLDASLYQQEAIEYVDMNVERLNLEKFKGRNSRGNGSVVSDLGTWRPRL